SKDRRSLALLAASALHLDRRAQGTFVDAFDEQLSGAVVATLVDEESCGPTVPDVIRQRIALEGRLLDHPHPRLRFLDWLLNGDGRTACDDPAGAARSLVALAADSSEMRRFLAPVFPALVKRADSAETRRAVVTHAAEFAAKHGLSGPCKRWRLALAAGSARAGDHRTADAQLEAAVNCGTDDRYGRAESILIAFVAFMRSGKLPRRLDSQLRPDLERLVRHRVDAACTGLADFDYRLAAALPDELVELASSLEPTLQKQEGMITIHSTRDELSDARDALRATKRALADGDFASASTKLRAAEKTFARLEHAPGLAQTHFLREVVVPDAPESGNDDSEGDSNGESSRAPGIAESCELDSTSMPTSPDIRRCLLAEHGATKLADAWQALPDGVSADQHAFLAALLLIDGRTRALAERAGGHDLSLCRPPRR
ncbi:MAG: hypothetical protein ABEN55_05980, partial [Bradymonadaceae bacterium]